MTTDVDTNKNQRRDVKCLSYYEVPPKPSWKGCIISQRVLHRGRSADSGPLCTVSRVIVFENPGLALSRPMPGTRRPQDLPGLSRSNRLGSTSYLWHRSVPATGTRLELVTLRSLARSCLRFRAGPDCGIAQHNLPLDRPHIFPICGGIYVAIIEPMLPLLRDG